MLDARPRRTTAVPPFRFAPERDARDKLPIFQQPRGPAPTTRGCGRPRSARCTTSTTRWPTTFERLEAAGVLDETAVIFTSDNGYTDRGQVNWDGKAIPYPASTDIPMLAYYPGAAPARGEQGVQLIDVAPTLYDVLERRSPATGRRPLAAQRRTSAPTCTASSTASATSWCAEESGRATGYVSTWRLLKHGRVGLRRVVPRRRPAAGARALPRPRDDPQPAVEGLPRPPAPGRASYG